MAGAGSLSLLRLVILARWGDLGILRVTERVCRLFLGCLGQIEALRVLSGPLQVILNMNLSISEPDFVNMSVS